MRARRRYRAYACRNGFFGQKESRITRAFQREKDGFDGERAEGWGTGIAGAGISCPMRARARARSRGGRAPI